MKAMILAAGRGERLGVLTKAKPKPLLEVGGESLIERHLRRLRAAGFDEVVINLSYLGELIRAALGDVSAWGQKISYSEEPSPALETGGGIINALSLFERERFLVVNADIYTEFDFSTLACDGHEAAMMLVPNPDHHPEGDFGVSTAGTMTIEGPHYTYGGVAVFSPSIFADFPPGRRPLRPILDAAIRRGVVRGAVYDGLWQDVGTPARLAEIRSRTATVR
jgi:N-acetyl-alpha-D-muramate 1-phosphate uridylyltransferase